MPVLAIRSIVNSTVIFNEQIRDGTAPTELP